MSAQNSVTPPSAGVAWGILGSLVPAAVVLLLALFLNWGN